MEDVKHQNFVKKQMQLRPSNEVFRKLPSHLLIAQCD